MCPLALAFGKFHKVGYRLGSFFVEEAAYDVAFAGFKGCIESGLARHGFLSKVVVSRWSLVVHHWPGCLVERYFGAAGGFVGVAAAGLFACVAGLASGPAAAPRTIVR